ncbi:MAG: hypothetical protein NVSMB9_11290 [Isosphaeraceae bacterium]
MNWRSDRSLARWLKELDRRHSRPMRWRFPTSAFVLALGLVLADLLLTRLVPRVWHSLLPGGLEQAMTLQGWPGLVWRSAVFCHDQQGFVQVSIGLSLVLAILLSLAGRLPRLLVWLSAVGIILVDAGILVVTIQSSLRATAASAGLDLGGP